MHGGFRGPCRRTEITQTSDITREPFIGVANPYAVHSKSLYYWLSSRGNRLMSQDQHQDEIVSNPDKSGITRARSQCSFQPVSSVSTKVLHLLSDY